MRGRWWLIALCFAVAAFAVLQYVAISRLEARQMELQERLELQLQAQREWLRERLESSATLDRDRFFQLTQSVQLEAVRTRTTVKESCP